MDSSEPFQTQEKVTFSLKSEETPSKRRFLQKRREENQMKNSKRDYSQYFPHKQISMQMSKFQGDCYQWQEDYFALTFFVFIASFILGNQHARTISFSSIKRKRI